MEETNYLIPGIISIVIGVALISFREKFGVKAASWYQKLGIHVPESLYVKQFLFVGVLLIIFGFLVSTKLIKFM